MLWGCYIHEENHTQYELCDSGVCSREIIDMFLVSQVAWHIENFNIGIFSDTIDAINVKLCVMVLRIELYLFISLSVTLTLFQGHSSVKLKISCSYLIKLKLCRIVKYIGQTMKVPLLLTFAHIQGISLTCFPIWQTLSLTLSRTLFKRGFSNFALCY